VTRALRADGGCSTVLPTEIVNLLCSDRPVLVCCTAKSQLTPLQTKKRKFLCPLFADNCSNTALPEGSKASPACPSDVNSVPCEMGMLLIDEYNASYGSLSRIRAISNTSDVFEGSGIMEIFDEGLQAAPERVGKSDVS